MCHYKKSMFTFYMEGISSYETRLKKISLDFSKLIDGVSDTESLSSEDREIIDKLREVAALLDSEQKKEH